jgi:hypothetical protein
VGRFFGGAADGRAKTLHRGHRGRAEKNLRKAKAFTAEAQRTQRKAKAAQMNTDKGTQIKATKVNADKTDDAECGADKWI